MIEYDPQPPYAAGHVNKASRLVIEQAENEMKRLAHRKKA